jgi:hypothetical protein
MAASKLALLESRVAILEAELAKLKKEAEMPVTLTLPWWEERWGLFDDEPDYEKAMELGRQYRESLRPKPVRSKSSKKTAKQKSVKNGK